MKTMESCKIGLLYIIMAKVPGGFIVSLETQPGPSGRSAAL